MNFWDTVLGHRLAEVLIKELPKINQNLEKLIEKKESENEAKEEK